jgi:hypothetical protein
MFSTATNVGRIALTCSLLATTACATSGPTFSEIHVTQEAMQKGFARIYFYRVGRFAGSAIQPAVKIDGIKAGEAVPGAYFYVDEPAGTYEVSTTTETKEYIKVSVRAGETRYVRLEVDWGYVVGRVTPVLVWPDQGLSEIQDLHYVGDK